MEAALVYPIELRSANTVTVFIALQVNLVPVLFGQQIQRRREEDHILHINHIVHRFDRRGDGEQVVGPGICCRPGNLYLKSGIHV